ncbi:hypothetical protein HMPREF1991_01743 [Hoylesella loescheii DSM 19665 = JCM 12249 = ATCC 15930]|uniref:Uncharacterized protein n=1 Tax=Hoylesella loescheii DSM 19665 = JCM 12249 = ATCC 15930 TaxID=1122985 RepID=A0A069QJK7_HOYLO|nr:hypothetical protein HMPREF1991_01743 [Hoylesella loescheii DSM 19665 = JCM 12249 = ATCC 15930]
MSSKRYSPKLSYAYRPSSIPIINPIAYLPISFRKQSIDIYQYSI